MNVAQMLAHLTDAMRMTFGELPVKPKHIPLIASFPFKQLVLYVLPLPKNSPTAPELLSRVPGSFEEEQRQCKSLIARFDAAPGAIKFAPHQTREPSLATVRRVTVNAHRPRRTHSEPLQAQYNCTQLRSFARVRIAEPRNADSTAHLDQVNCEFPVMELPSLTLALRDMMLPSRSNVPFPFTMSSRAMISPFH